MDTLDIQQKVTDKEDIRRYFAMIPHMADDDLTMHEYRLYGHYKRICGENGGSCTESERTTRSHLGIGRDKLREVRQSLVEKGYIHFTPGTPKSQECPEGRPATITCPSLWQQNNLRYMPETDKQQYLEQVVAIFGDDIMKMLQAAADQAQDDEPAPLEDLDEGEDESGSRSVEQMSEGPDQDPIGPNEDPMGPEQDPMGPVQDHKKKEEPKNLSLSTDETSDRGWLDPSVEGFRQLAGAMQGLNTNGSRTPRGGPSTVTALSEDAPDLCAGICHVWGKEAKKFKVSDKVRGELEGQIKVRNGLLYPSPNDLYNDDKVNYVKWLQTLPKTMERHNRRFTTRNLMHYILGLDYATVGYLDWRKGQGLPAIEPVGGEIVEAMQKEKVVNEVYENDPIYQAEQALLKEVLNE